MATCRGRPRDPGIESAVLRATRHRLAVDGYSRMTVADIAADAGVTRPTVYRRWPTKLDLVTAALDYSFLQEQTCLPEPDVTGLPLADALPAVLRRMREGFLRPEGMALIGSVLNEEKRKPELIELCRQHAIEPRLKHLVETLERAQSRGEISAAVDLDAVVSMLYGSFYAKYLRTGDLPEHFPDNLAATILPALLSLSRGVP